MSINFSLEVFPPKVTENNFWQTIQSFVAFKPEFISITCGAGGSNLQDSTQIATKIIKDFNFQAVSSHMVCLGRSKSELLDLAAHHYNSGVRRIVALRGDVSHSNNKDNSSKFAHAHQLVSLLKQQHDDWDISVAGYPETHPDAISSEQDILHLKNKVDCGANRILTQFFFDVETFLRYRDKVTKAGINVPIIPGILPIIKFDNMVNFAQKCQTQVPKFLHDLFNGLSDDSADNKETHDMLSFAFFTQQIELLKREGVEDFHFYTLNNINFLSVFNKWISAFNGK